MNKALKQAKTTAGWLWKHTSAGVAVVLIIGALIVGYRLGRPAPEPTPEAAEVDSGASPADPQMYTCSMHPSVRLPDPDAKCPICFMDLIPVSDDGGEGSELRVIMSEEAAVFGKVTYDETAVARLTAYFPGRIERLFVNFVGIRVARGDHIAEVYSPDLLAAFEDLRQAARSSDESAGMSDIVRDAAGSTPTG